MRMELARWTEQKGTVVKWGNIVGPYCGQRGTYYFASTEEAQRFSEYAQSKPAPSLADDDLKRAGIPMPTKRADY